MKWNRVLWAVVVASLLVGTTARAANRIFIENAQFKAGVDGHELLVKMENDIEVYAVSLSIAFDPAVLEIVSIEPAGVALSAEWEAGTDLNQIDNSAGEIVYGFLTEFDFSGATDNAISPGDDQVVARIVFKTLDIERTTTVLDLRDGLRTSEIQGGAINALVDGSGTTFRAGSVNSLVLGDATLTIDPLRPEIQLIEDNSGAEGDIFSVVGRNFGEPGLAVQVCGRATAFELQGDGQTLNVTAPACPECPNTELCWAELEVINENGSDTETNGFQYEPPPVPVIGEPILDSNRGDPGKNFFQPGQNFFAPLTVELCDVELVEGSGYSILNDATLQITAPNCDSFGWAPLRITNSFGTTTRGEGFFYEPPAPDPLPEISTLAQNSGAAGATFTISGTNFQVGDNSLTVRVCGNEASIVFATDTAIQVVAPACDTLGWALLEVINEFGRATEGEGFFYEEIVVIGTEFVRGDANNDGAVDISDAIAILADRFLGDTAAAPCLDALDVNDDGQVDISDPIALLQFQFLGTFVIPAPHPNPGLDPTDDNLPSC